jgi:hypothetical protein
VNASYQGIYTDRFGGEPIIIHNDGRVLRTIIRGVRFWGYDFDGLSPEEDTPPEKLASFTLQRGDLCSCVIECDIPVPVVIGEGITEGRLRVRLDLGEPADNGGIDRETLNLSLTVGGNTSNGSGRSGWFEDELLELQAALPEGTYMKACINCAFSDYSPYGHGLFGNLACFRDNKEEYLRVKTKGDIFRVWDTLTEYVQETYLCPEFRKRRPGTGYRG